MKKNQVKNNENNKIENQNSDDKIESTNSQIISSNEDIKNSDTKNDKIKQKKKVTFNEEENIYIAFDENEKAKKIKIYNYEGAQMPLKKFDFKKYIINLKNNKKLKSILLVNSLDGLSESLQQKMALYKLSELIDECNERSDANESSLKDKMIASKNANKSRNDQNIINLKKIFEKNNLSSNDVDICKKEDKKFKKKKFNDYNNYEEKKMEKKNNREKKILFSEKIKANNLNKFKKRQNKQKGSSFSPIIYNSNKAKIDKKNNVEVNKAINHLKKYFENNKKEKK